MNLELFKLDAKEKVLISPPSLLQFEKTEVDDKGKEHKIQTTILAFNKNRKELLKHGYKPIKYIPLPHREGYNYNVEYSEVQIDIPEKIETLSDEELIELNYCITREWTEIEAPVLPPIPAILSKKKIREFMLNISETKSRELDALLDSNYAISVLWRDSIDLEETDPSFIQAKPGFMVLFEGTGKTYEELVAFARTN